MSVVGQCRVSSWQVSPFTFDGIPYASVEYSIDVMTQGPIDLDALMDAIAAKVPSGLTTRVFAYPTDKISPPCAVVGYPTGPNPFDMTFQRGSDSVTIPLYFVIGKWVERNTRKAVADALTGATGIKDALDGQLGS